MRNLKRALSLALAFVMVLSMMVVGAGAVSVDDFSDSAEIVNKEAVAVLATLNVITGQDDGSYNPTGSITRGEMSTIICRVLNGGNNPVLGETVTDSYTDTGSHWAKAYIEYCTTRGIVAGKGDGTFDPNGNVTVSEAAKMVLVALGYNAAVEGYTGGNWQINTDVQANSVGLYNNLSYTNTSAVLTRDNAAQMLYNALSARVVTYDYVITGDANNAITTRPQINDWDRGTMLWEYFNAIRVEGVVVANEFANLEATYREDTDMAPTQVNIGAHLNTNRTTIKVSNYDPATEQRVFANTNVTFNVTTGEEELGKGVYVFVRPYSASTGHAGNHIITTQGSSDGSRATVIGSVVISDQNVIVTDASGGNAEDVAHDNNLELAEDVRYFYNYGSIQNNDMKNGYVGVQKTLVDVDNDTEIEYVLLKEMRLGKVTLKDETGDGRLVVNINGFGTPVDTGNYQVSDMDDAMGFDNVAVDDFVLTAFIGGRLHVQVAETMTGTIEAYKQTEATDTSETYRNTNITVDGENYTVSRVGAFEGGELTAAVRPFDRSILDSEATFYLDENGYIVSYGEVDGTAYKYALVWAAEDHSRNRVDPDRVKVTLEDGTTATYDLDSASNIDVVADKAYTNSTYENGEWSIRESDMEGAMFGYVITSSGDIKLTLPLGGTVSGEGPNFVNGLTQISMSGSADVNYLTPNGVNPPNSNRYYANNATAFFYVERNRNGEITDVDVFNGRNNAPTVDVNSGDNDRADVRVALRYNRDNSDVGAVAFYDVERAQSAGLHLFVTASNYVSSDYVTVDAFLNNSVDLTSVNVSEVDGVSVEHNPLIEDGLYLYSVNSDGYYELTTPNNDDQEYFYNGVVSHVDTRNKSFVVAGDFEAFITENSVIVDNTAGTAYARFNGNVTIGDRVQVIVDNTNNWNVLMLGIMEKDQPIDVGGEDTGVVVDGNWTIPETGVANLDIGASESEIMVALAQNDYVVIYGTYTADSRITIPAGKTLHVVGDLLNGQNVVNNGTLKVEDNLTGAVAGTGYVLVGSTTGKKWETSGLFEGTAEIDNGGNIDLTGAWTVDSGALVRVEGDVNGGTNNVTVEGTLNVGGSMTANTINVLSANTLTVHRTLTATTLNVGDDDNAGRVVAGEIKVTKLNVANSGSTVVVQQNGYTGDNKASLTTSGTLTVPGLVMETGSVTAVNVNATGNVIVENATLTVTGTLTANNLYVGRDIASESATITWAGTGTATIGTVNNANIYVYGASSRISATDVRNAATVTVEAGTLDVDRTLEVTGTLYVGKSSNTETPNAAYPYTYSASGTVTANDVDAMNIDVYGNNSEISADNRIDVEDSITVEDGHIDTVNLDVVGTLTLKGSATVNVDGNLQAGGIDNQTGNDKAVVYGTYTSRNTVSAGQNTAAMAVYGIG